MVSPNISELLTTTMENRSGKVRDNTRKNNAILMRLSKKGKIRPFSGGTEIREEISFGENPNASWYSGYDILPLAASDVLTSAKYTMKLLAVPVIISGEEKLQNSGKEALIDLAEQRIQNADATMANIISEGIYSDGTGHGGKQITGLDAANPLDPTTGTYGAINRALWTFWRNKVVDTASAVTTATIGPAMNSLWVQLVRGADRPDLIMSGGNIFATYLASLQALQRFTGTAEAELGFPSVKFMDADVVLDGGIGGFANADTMHFLNTNYLHFRPHRDRNMVPIGKKRQPVNQDADVEILGFAGNLTCSGAQFLGRLYGG
jgi:hypothetical protein